MASASVAEQTWIDGRKYFDRTQDRQRQTEVADMRQALIARLAASPVWRAGFISNLAASAPISAADALFLEMAAKKLRIEDREFEPLLRRHLAIKDYDRTERATFVRAHALDRKARGVFHKELIDLTLHELHPGIVNDQSGHGPALHPHAEGYRRQRLRQ
jgi:hypothetical protein